MVENVIVPSEILSEDSLNKINFFGNNYSFEEQDFRDAVSKIGVRNLASGLVGIAQENDETPEGLFSEDSLRDGTSILQGLLPGNAGLTPEERKWDDTDIITYFSNVNDFGGGSDAKSRAFISRLERSAVPSIAMLGGGIGGARLASSIPSLIYSATKAIPNPYVKLGAGILGFLSGSILGESGTRKVQDRIFGKVDPVTPDLQSSAIAGDILPYGISVVLAPHMLARKTGGLGAIKFLEDFRRVSSSGTLRLPGPSGTSLNDKNLIAVAKNAGLSVKDYIRAAINQQKTQGSKNITDLLKPDPSKGPLTMRALAALERGLVTAGQAGRGELGKGALLTGLGIDAISAGGSSFGGYWAEEFRPNELGYRVFGEITGAGAPGLAAIAGLKSAPVIPAVFSKAKNIFKRYVQKNPNVVSDAMKNDATKRLYAALESSTELNSVEELNQFILDLGSLEIPRGFFELDEAGNPILDATGNPIKLKLTASNVAAAKNLPLQKTLSLIENELSRAGDELSIQSKKGRANFIQGSKSMIMLLRKSGEPDALKLATEIEENLYTQNITDNLQIAINRLLSASETLTKGNLEKIPFGPSVGKNPYAGTTSEITSIDLSEKLNQLVRKQLQTTKVRERQLWDAVGNEEIVTFFDVDGNQLLKPNLLNFLDNVDFGTSKAARSEFEKNLGSLDFDIQDFKKLFKTGDDLGDDLIKKVFGDDLGDVAESGEDLGRVTVARLQEMRRIAGDKAAELRKQGKNSAAKPIEAFRAAITRDLLGDPTLKTDTQPALNTARAYTKARYTAFGTDTFPGKINQKTGRGDFVLSPQATVDMYFRGGANPNLLRTQEILSAGDFMVQNGVADAALLNGTTSEVLEAVLRDAQKNIFDTKTINVMGKETQVLEVNATKLDRWKNKDSNKRLMAIFPDIARDLKSVETAQNLFDTLGKDLKFLQNNDKVKAFKAVMGSENPSVAVSKALASPVPTQSLLELVGFANTSGKIVNQNGEVFTNQQAREGLMNGIVDLAVQNSGGGGSRFNAQSFFDFMFTPRPRGDLKDDLILADFMVKNELMSADQLKTMKQATKEMINVDDALARGDLESVLFKNPTGMKMLQVKMIGATLGGAAQKRLSNLLKKVGFPGGGGGTLVAAGEGAKQLQNLLLVGPESIRQKYMVELMSDAPELSKQLLKLVTNKQKKASERSVEKFFVNLGLNTAIKRGYLVGRDREEDRLDFLDSLPIPSDGPEINNENIGPSSSVVPNQDELRTSFLQRSKDPASGLGQSGGSPPTKNSVDRARFAALFPEDRDLIGIGSLMS